MAIDRLNVHVYPSPFKHETRILRITETLIARALVKQILVVGIAEDGLCLEEKIDDNRRVRRFRLFKYGNHRWLRALQFFEFYIRVFLGLRNEDIGIINCHSLSVLPLCVALKRWHRVPLVYEPHELETETAQRRGIGKVLSKWIEKRLVGEAIRVIAVSNSIAERYCKNYGLTEVGVILNVPRIETGMPARKNHLLRQVFNIPERHLVFMYQGLFDHARCVGHLLEAFRLVPLDYHLVLMGFGPLENRVKSTAAAASNIHFHPAVSGKNILQYTRCADVGFALLTDNCLNHQFALPNKLFHYLHAGLPVVTSKLKEMSMLVDHYQCGWKVANDVRALADCIAAIKVTDLERYSEGALRAKNDFHWEREADKLEIIYGGLR